MAYLKYTPIHERKMGDPSPQKTPSKFRTEDLVLEVKELMRMNRVLGFNELRTLTYMKLMRYIGKRLKKEKKK